MSQPKYAKRVEDFDIQYLNPSFVFCTSNAPV